MMNKINLILSSLLLLFCIPATPKTESDSVRPAPGHWQQEMLDAINKARTLGCHCGSKIMPPVPPVTWSDRLAKAALNHARDMEEHNFIGHRGSGGSKIGERASRAGYDWQSVGENIAWGDLTVKSVVHGWLDSPGHCLTLMHGGYNEIGVARQGNYYVQFFGREWK